MQNRRLRRLHFQRMQLRKLKPVSLKSCKRLSSKSAVVQRQIVKLFRCSMRFINNGKIYRIYDSGHIQVADLLSSLKSLLIQQPATKPVELTEELSSKATRIW